MDIRYFYVGDHIQNKTLCLHHCPTEEMLADYFTKPLQGSLFVRLRNHIMGAEFEDGNPKLKGVCWDVTTIKKRWRHPNGTSRGPNGTRIECWRGTRITRMCVWCVRRGTRITRKHVMEVWHGTRITKMITEEMRIFGGTNEKQMTYREALLGLGNSELSSDF